MGRRIGRHKKALLTEAAEAYIQAGSIAKAAKDVGVSPATIQRRLAALVNLLPLTPLALQAQALIERNKRLGPICGCDTSFSCPSYGEAADVRPVNSPDPILIETAQEYLRAGSAPSAARNMGISDSTIYIRLRILTDDFGEHPLSKKVAAKLSSNKGRGAVALRSATHNAQEASVERSPSTCASMKTPCALRNPLPHNANPPNERLGEELWARRVVLGLSQSDVSSTPVCHEAGVSEEALSSIESGGMSPTLNELWALAEVYGVHPLTLLERALAPQSTSAPATKGLELEQENEGLAEENSELHECLNDLYMAILEAGWMPQRDEQWVTLHVTPEQIEQLEELLGDDDG